MLSIFSLFAETSQRGPCVEGKIHCKWCFATTSRISCSEQCQQRFIFDEIIDKSSLTANAGNASDVVSEHEHDLASFWVELLLMSKLFSFWMKYIFS